MSSNTVGALKRFLSRFADEDIVYGYEEVGGITFGPEGPSAIVVRPLSGDGGVFHTGDYAWSGNADPKLDNQ